MRRLLLISLIAVLGAADLDDAELQRRIRELRTVNLILDLPAGVTGTVRYRLARHAFPFGTAVGAGMMDGPWARKDRTQADRDTYGRIAREYFTAAVAENEFKWYAMEKVDGTQDATRAELVYEWCRARDLTLRGHCIWWGVPKWQPDWMKELPTDQVETRMKRRLAFVTQTFRGRIAEWDLMNELTDHDLFAAKAEGLNAAAYFRWAVEADPQVRWFVNEYGPLQFGKMEATEKLMQNLQTAGVRVDGLGDQAHFFGPLPDNTVLWQRLDRLAAFKVPLLITEYDQAWKGMTEEQQGEALRRFVTLCFAHPAVHGIYLWGFWDGQHWRKDCGLWRQDWTIKPNGQAWVDLLTKTWTTTGEAAATADGLRFRGFPGTYRIEHAGGTVEVRARTAPAVP